MNNNKGPILYSPEPLLELANAVLGVDAPKEEIGDLLGVASRTVLRWQAGTQVSEAVADRVAIRLKLHPALLWPEYWANCPEPNDEDYDDEDEHTQLDLELEVA